MTAAIPKFSWIQEVLHRFDPKADLSKGFDVDGNGRIEGKEKLQDANHNGILGDAEDWQAFLKKNPELRSGRVPFFKLFGKSGTKFKPTNPLHDILSIEAEILPDEVIKNSYDKVAKIADRVRSSVAKHPEWKPVDKLRAVYQAMRDEGIKFQVQLEVQHDPLFATNMASGSLDCDTSSDVVVAVAHEMGWPVSMVEVPEHVFVRWDDGKTSFNMDFGAVPPDEFYQKVFLLDPSTIRNGIYMKDLERDEMDSLYMENRGHAKHDLGNYQAAIEDYSQAIRLNLKNVEAFHNRGSIKETLGNHHDAIKDYDKVIWLDPKYANAFYGRGYAEEALGNYQDAIKDFDEAIRLNPKRADAFYNRGLAKETLGNYQDAIGDYDEAIRLDPKNAKAFYNRGRLTKETLGNYQDAIRDFDEAIRLNPQSPGALYHRGVAKAELGNLNDAAVDLKEAARDPSLKPYAEKALKKIHR